VIVSEAKVTDETIDLGALIGRLRKLGRDTANVEVKAAEGGLPASLLESICAFANTSGGTVILGLDESSGFTPVSSFDAVKTGERLKEIVRPRRAGETAAPIEPTPSVRIAIQEFEGGEVVVAQVEELAAEQKPCFVVAKGKEGGSYERLLDGDHRMGTHAIFLLSSNRAQPLRDIDPVSGTSRADLDPDLSAGLIARVKRTRPRILAIAHDDDEILQTLRVVDASGALTVAGLLALGRYPQAFFPQLMVSFASFPLASKDATLGTTRMLDRANFEGPIPLMVGDVIRKVRDSLRVRRVAAGSTARDVPEIPLDVVREAVVNAVAHRDYSHFAESEQVRVELYPDRLEVSNPGGIWGGRSEWQLLDGTSRSRNSFLTRLLTDVPTGDEDSTMSENQGTGIRYMVGSMKEFGLPLPSLRATTSSFTTSLARHGLLDPDMAAHLDNVGAQGLDERKRAILALALQRDRVDDQVVRYQLDMDSFDAWKTLESLANSGWLVEAQRGRFAAAPRLLNTPLPLEVEADSHSVSDARGVLALLQRDGELDINDIATRLDLSVNVARSELRNLVGRGLVIATAPPTSRLRRYRLP
jgi:ATP-dependent DNA helicase RecG